MTEPTSFEQIREERRGLLYPRQHLVGMQSALVLFAAGFYGANDAFWIADAGIEDVVCVDTDIDKLTAMARCYPESWQFVALDWIKFVGKLPVETKYDVVSADCPLALTLVCATRIDIFLHLTRYVLTLTTLPEMLPLIEERAGDGYEVESIRRSNTTCWAVITLC